MRTQNNTVPVAIDVARTGLLLLVIPLGVELDLRIISTNFVVHMPILVDQLGVKPSLVIHPTLPSGTFGFHERY